MQPGERRCLDNIIAIFDDNVAERKYEVLRYSIGVYTPIPFHSNHFRQRDYIRIEDDEGKEVCAVVLCSVSLHEHDMAENLICVCYLLHYGP